MAHTRKVAAALGVTLAVAALTTAPVPAAPEQSRPAADAAPLAWGPCPDPEDLDPRQECALLAVPLDYDAPDGPTIEVAVSRIVTSDPALRQGVILFNPGGPGGAGLDLPTLFAQLLAPDVLARFDLIGFDPRFIGRSTPLTCGLPADEHLVLKVIPWLRPGGVAENYAVAEEVSAACAANAGEVLVHGTTTNTARDMDRIREALGEAEISYVGYSYGSYLGAVYASLFPDRTDRFVLDSVVNPFGIWRGVFRSWGPAVEIRFPDLTGWIAERDDVYGLGPTSREVRAKYFALAARLDVDPIQLPGVLLTGNQFREATRGGLYSDSIFPDVAALWQFVDVTASGGGAPASLGVELMALFPEVPEDNGVAGLLAILCDDAEWPRNPGTYERDVRIDRRLFPVAGAMAANAWTCAAWAFDPVDPLVPITDDGPANVLLVQNTRDPATPYWGAVAMRFALGGRSRLVTVNEGGHGIFAFGENACADATTNSFLVSGSLPTGDRFCPADGPVNAQQHRPEVDAVRAEMYPL